VDIGFAGEFRLSFFSEREDKERKMTLTEARKILGLGPDEDPRPHLAEFHAVRERIADMVRTAPNDHLAQRYQEGLVEFDRALAAVREYLEALGLVPRVADVRVEEPNPAERGHPVFVEANVVTGNVALPAISQPTPDSTWEVEDPEPSVGRVFRIVAWTLVFLSLVGFGGWAYLKVEEEKRLTRDARIAFLERQGAIFIENRRWPEAAEAFDEIEDIDPESDLVSIGRRSIEAGMAEEQNQYIAYWTGEAIAAFEASRWDDSEKAARQVLDKYPSDKETKALIARIAEAKREEEREAAFASIRERITKREFDGAISAARKLSETDPEALPLLKEAQAAKDEAEADLLAARDLLAQAAAMDKGEFDQKALELMREALALAPDDKEIVSRYEKMAAYTRTIRVPGDFSTVQEALAAARDKDRLVIAKGTWEGPFLISAAIELEGSPGKTVIQCGADIGSVIAFAPGVKGARLSGLTLRHLSFDAGAERFSLALVNSAEADFSDCRFEQGSGHGIAVTGGGHARVLRSRFSENGWNGIAVMGEGSLLVAEENTLEGNFQNGIEAWDGAEVILSKNKCTGNSRNGIHVDCGMVSVTILDNTLSGNREFGLVLSSAGGGEVTRNTMMENFLGGMVVKQEAGKTAVRGNIMSDNGGPGLAIGKGLSGETYTANRATGNKGQGIVTDVDLSAED
jgi:parallel beta-helix repeat protein